MTRLRPKPADPRQQVLLFEPNQIEKQYLKDLWRYRQLFAILAWRDVSERFKKTAFWVDWVLIRLFLTMVVITPGIPPNANTQRLHSIRWPVFHP